MSAKWGEDDRLEILRLAHTVSCLSESRGIYQCDAFAVQVADHAWCERDTFKSEGEHPYLDAIGYFLDRGRSVRRHIMEKANPEVKAKVVAAIKAGKQTSEEIAKEFHVNLHQVAAWKAWANNAKVDKETGRLQWVEKKPKVKKSKKGEAKKNGEGKANGNHKREEPAGSQNP
jgi:transposase-like protein